MINLSYNVVQNKHILQTVVVLSLPRQVKVVCQVYIIFYPPHLKKNLNPSQQSIKIHYR